MAPVVAPKKTLMERMAHALHLAQHRMRNLGCDYEQDYDFRVVCDVSSEVTIDFDDPNQPVGRDARKLELIRACLADDNLSDLAKLCAIGGIAATVPVQEEHVLWAIDQLTENRR